MRRHGLPWTWGMLLPTIPSENESAMDQATMPLLLPRTPLQHEPVRNDSDRELGDSSNNSNEDPILHLSQQMKTSSNISTSPHHCTVPLGGSPLGQALAAPRKETYDYLRNATMTAASAVLLFCEFGVHYYANHIATQRLPWGSAERSIAVFLTSSVCYRAGMNVVESRQSTFMLLLPELLTLLSLVCGILHALRLASLILVFGSMYLMIFALTSTVDKFVAMNEKLVEEEDEEKSVQRSRSV